MTTINSGKKMFTAKLENWKSGRPRIMDVLSRNSHWPRKVECFLNHFFAAVRTSMNILLLFLLFKPKNNSNIKYNMKYCVIDELYC